MTGIWKWVVFWSNYVERFRKSLEQEMITMETKQKIFNLFKIFYEFEEYP